MYREKRMGFRRPFNAFAASVLMLLVMGASFRPAFGAYPTDWKKGQKSSSGVSLGDGYTVGEASQVENVTLFAVYRKDQADLGEFITLDEALSSGVAEVREKGAGGGHHNHHRQSYDDAQVNTLIIQNNGGQTILVLAGTVVIGGKQDRQIGQDFVIPPYKTVPIDAFCVEHGRWQQNREGASTGGKFGSAGMLANQKVRAAAQYEGDQSEVWNQVGKVNKDARKEAGTGTLLATLADKEVAQDREDMTEEMSRFLRKLDRHDEIVGIAYAVDGEVRGARWFANHAIFSKFEKTLLNTVATEALTSQSAAKADGRSVDTTKAAPGKVKEFVDDLKQAKVTAKKKTAADNENQYRESSKGYSSECLIKQDGAAMPVTTDFLSK